MIECAICRKEFKSLTNSHLRDKHQITNEQYKEMFPYYPTKNKSFYCSTKCLNCNKWFDNTIHINGNYSKCCSSSCSTSYTLRGKPSKAKRWFECYTKCLNCNNWFENVANIKNNKCHKFCGHPCSLKYNNENGINYRFPKGNKPWQTGLTVETSPKLKNSIDKSIKTRKENLASGKTKSWNNGLTKETDERIARMSEARKGSGNPMFGKNVKIFKETTCEKQVEQHFIDSNIRYQKQFKISLPRREQIL